jgi:predicted nucleic acid-binding protein
MTVRPFIDTNILVYAHDEDEPHKREIALAWLDDHADELVVSSQVLAEFYVTVTRKLARPMQPAAAAEQVDELTNATVVVVDGELVRSAARLSQTHEMSLWDAMIVRAAVRGGCDHVVTEDLTHGAVVDGVRILNPFVIPPD